MTAGITGVVWLPRTAEVNCATLYSGAHAIPIAAAGGAWGLLTAAWVDATATVVRVMAELGVGMQGVNGLAVIGRLTGFTGWAEQQGVQAGILAAKATANVTAYTIASLVMPSPPEIAAAETARVAAHTTGGMLNGTAEIAEAAKAAIDLRAALVMETYEAATSAMVAVPADFLMPPPIANGAGSAAQGPVEEAFGGNPISAVAGAAGAIANNPAVVSGATQAANVAGTVATGGVSTASSIGSNAISAVTSSPAVSSPGISMGGLGMAGMGAAGTRSAAMGTGSGLSNFNGSAKFPEGWGAPSGGNPSTATVPENVVVNQNGGAPVRPAGGSGGNPLLGNQARSDGEDDGEHKGNDYLRSTEHFNDGRSAADGVIGADFSGAGK
ncbi:PPE domain-containing protein [Nocardia callitridis]|uniref:PPE domain-containing protein n=1 Tax=Nocardia callitridis TaxID=648753 RepID=A0ABP9JXP2_9NOCA